MSLAVFLKSLFTGQEPRTPFALSPDDRWRPRAQHGPEGRSEGAERAYASGASRQPGVRPPPPSPAGRAPRGKLAAEPSAEEPRAQAQAEARGPLCGALPEG